MEPSRLVISSTAHFLDTLPPPLTLCFCSSCIEQINSKRFWSVCGALERTSVAANCWEHSDCRVPAFRTSRIEKIRILRIWLLSIPAPPPSQLPLPSDVVPTNDNDAPKGAGMQQIAGRPLFCKLEPAKHHFFANCDSKTTCYSSLTSSPTKYMTSNCFCPRQRTVWRVGDVTN